MKLYNKHNFHKHTFCIFKEVDQKKLKHGKPDYTSKSGSSYYFTKAGVYRISNHWGRAANCKWRLQPIGETVNRTRIGYANWNEFQPDNDIEKLYYIEMDPATGKVSYNHANNSKEDTVVLRTASETTKRIRQIRQLIKAPASLQHFDALTQQAVINKLIDTDKTLLEIKKDFLQ